MKIGHLLGSRGNVLTLPKIEFARSLSELNQAQLRAIDLVIVGE